VKIRKVVSVCALSDIKVWQLASGRILDHIEADTYELIVPRKDRRKFEKTTPARFGIKCDEDYIPDERRMVISDILNSKGERSANWFIQQFLKISAILTEGDDDVVLIWDADTIPMKDLSFISDDGVLSCYKSTEYHQDYFITLREILGIERLAQFSFIAQCLPVYAKWVKEMIIDIEKSAQGKWMETICNVVTGPTSQFSEYETIGNYAQARYPEELAFNDKPWFRNAAIGLRKDVTIEKLEKLFSTYDFISLEKGQFTKSIFEIWYKKTRRDVRKIRDRLMLILKKKNPGFGGRDTQYE
jgi:hypothetical protein